MRWTGQFVLLGIAAALAVGCGAPTTEAKGEGGIPVIHWTNDRDPTGAVSKLVARCNAENEDKWRIEEVVMPPTVDAKREQIIRRLAAKDPALDIITIDVVWTAELSQAGWIVDLTDRLGPMRDQFVPAAMATAVYDEKIWAVPMNTNVALLYYRTDLVKKPPETWEDLLVQSKAIQAKNPDMYGFLFQALQYEGLTVDAMEFMTSAGGQVLDESGTKSLVADGPATRGIEFMRQLVEEGVTPRAVTTMMEEESRMAFQNGQVAFLRNWPYVYALANDPSSKVAGKFDVSLLPGFADGKRSGVLGGANLAISAFSPYPEETWDAMQCLGMEGGQKTRALFRGELPTLETLYDDPEILAKLPYLTTARKALDTALPRPVTPYYSEASRAIYLNANEAVAGRITPDEAIKRMNTMLQRAIDGVPEV